jgi:hypothetical protein
VVEAGVGGGGVGGGGADDILLIREPHPPLPCARIYS